MDKELIIVIGLDGSMEFIHDDALIPLIAEGAAIITRASEVEPSGAFTADYRPLWYADMSRVGGGIHHGFTSRSEALSFERDYIHREVFSI